MTLYKITNITDLLGKREHQYNTNLNIEYVDGMLKKKLVLKPSETIVLSINSLPLSVHRLRVQKLVTVVEISGIEQNVPIKEKVAPKKQNVDNEEKKTTKKTNPPLKKKINKDHDDSYLVVPK